MKQNQLLTMANNPITGTTCVGGSLRYGFDQSGNIQRFNNFCDDVVLNTTNKNKNKSLQVMSIELAHVLSNNEWTEIECDYFLDCYNEHRVEIDSIDSDGFGDVIQWHRNHLKETLFKKSGK